MNSLRSLKKSLGNRLKRRGPQQQQQQQEEVQQDQSTDGPKPGTDSSTSASVADESSTSVASSAIASSSAAAAVESDQRPQASADSGPSSSVADEQSMSAKSATSASSSAATAAAAESDEKNVSDGASSRDGQAAQATSSQQLQQHDTVETFRQKYLSSDARVINEIKAEDSVRGVTSVDDELFVLLDRVDNQVAVHSINDYQLLRHLNVPQLKSAFDSSNYMTSCARHKCLYMSDDNYSDSCIHRYQLASSAISKWAVPYKPFCLSVTPSGDLLVTCPWANKLVELSADNGQCVRQIALQADIESPWHGVQLTTGQFVVCHGDSSSDFHRVCVVGDDGSITCSYGGQRGSDVGQLNYPRHLAVDKDSQFIFAVDECNDKVMLLSPTLEFVRNVTGGLSGAWRLYFDHTTRCLFLSGWYGGVTVIQF